MIVVVKTLEDGPLARIQRPEHEVLERHIKVRRSISATDDVQGCGVCLASSGARGIDRLEARHGNAVLRGFPFESRAKSWR
jgi:hypothetical protein